MTRSTWWVAVQWNSDGDDDEEGRANLELPSPKDLAYKPRTLVSCGAGAANAGAAGGGKRNRWTDEEVENLKAGVKRCAPEHRVHPRLCGCAGRAAKGTGIPGFTDAIGSQVW